MRSFSLSVKIFWMNVIKKSYKMEKRIDCRSYLPLACSIDYKQYEEIVLASRRHLMFITCVHQVYQFFQNGDCHS